MRGKPERSDSGAGLRCTHRSPDQRSAPRDPHHRYRVDRLATTAGMASPDVQLAWRAFVNGLNVSRRALGRRGMTRAEVDARVLFDECARGPRHAGAISPPGRSRAPSAVAADRDLGDGLIADEGPNSVSENPGQASRPAGLPGRRLAGLATWAWLRTSPAGGVLPAPRRPIRGRPQTGSGCSTGSRGIARTSFWDRLESLVKVRRRQRAGQHQPTTTLAPTIASTTLPSTSASAGSAECHDPNPRQRRAISEYPQPDSNR